jgi:hypothetical protein
LSARGRKILRVVWLPVLGAVLAAALTAAVGRSPERYEATLLLVVPAGASVAPGPADAGSPTSVTTTDLLGRPSEAQRLAGTYATLIPADTATLGAVAEVVGRPVDELRGQVRATAVSDSSLISVAVDAPTALEATRAIEALGVALTGRPPASPAIAPGSLVLVSVDEPSAVGGLPSGAVPSAGLAGALLGAFAAVAWTRQDRRVDGAADLDPLDLPTIELDTIDRRTTRAAVSGVLVASGLEVGEETPVHLLAAGRRSDPLTARIAAVLPSRLDPVGAPRTRFPLGETVRQLGPAVRYGGPVSGAPSPIALSEPGVAVVVVRRGTRLVEVARAVATIERFGSVVAGALVAAPDASAGSGSAARSAVAETSVPARDGPGEPASSERPGEDGKADVGEDVGDPESSSAPT